MGCYDNTDSPMSLFPQPSSPKCPMCRHPMRQHPNGRAEQRLNHFGCVDCPGCLAIADALEAAESGSTEQVQS